MIGACENQHESKNISIQQYKLELKDISQKIEHGKILDSLSKIRVIQLINSCVHYKLDSDSEIVKCYPVLLKYYADSLEKKFGFQFSIGGSSFSRSLNIFIGGLPFYNNGFVAIDSATLPIKSKVIVRDFILMHKESKEAIKLLTQ